ncbi:MAG: hypothetical protein ACM3H9_03485 [Rhodospirillaceae bacterium]
MRRLARELIVTMAAGVCLAGPVAAVVVPLSPASWRSALLVWGLLLGAVALVAWLRRRRWTRP